MKRKGFKMFDKNIMLIGFMGTGKSTISACLGQMLGRAVVDTDKLIEEYEGISIREIFDKYGEDYFRSCETKTLLDLKHKKELIVSCGGGIVLKEENIKHMKDGGRIVLLTAEPETVLGRVRNDKSRPILNGNMNVDFISRLMEKRQEKYLKAADIIVCTDHKSVPEICSELVSKLDIFEERQEN